MTQAETTSTREELPGLLASASFPNPISWANAAPGYGVTGKVIRIGQMQSRNYDTGEPEVWKSGDPKMLDVVVIDVNGMDQSWFVRGYSSVNALRSALKEAHVTGLAVGDILTVEYSRDEPTIDPKTGKESKALNPTKIFTVTLTPVK